MSWFAWALVLAGAVCHALWNLIAKQVASGGAPFVWLYGVVSLCWLTPLAIWQAQALIWTPAMLAHRRVRPRKPARLLPRPGR